LSRKWTLGPPEIFEATFCDNLFKTFESNFDVLIFMPPTSLTGHWDCRSLSRKRQLVAE
jgi:hypothetical protein